MTDNSSRSNLVLIAALVGVVLTGGVTAAAAGTAPTSAPAAADASAPAEAPVQQVGTDNNTTANNTTTAAPNATTNNTTTAANATGNMTGNMSANASGNGTASLLFPDQNATDEVVIEEANLSQGGVVAVFNSSGGLIGVSEYLQPGNSTNVTVPLMSPLENDAVLVAEAYMANESVTPETFNASTAQPYTENNTTVADTAFIIVGGGVNESTETAVTSTPIDTTSEAGTEETTEGETAAAEETTAAAEGTTAAAEETTAAAEGTTAAGTAEATGTGTSTSGPGFTGIGAVVALAALGAVAIARRDD